MTFPILNDKKFRRNVYINFNIRNTEADMEDKQYLFCPGPVTVSETVRKDLLHPGMCNVFLKTMKETLAHFKP